MNSLQNNLVALDANWWFGSSRLRGIGRYLDAFFQHELKIPEANRRWIIPENADEKLIQRLLKRYGGEVVRFPFSQSLSTQRRFWQDWAQSSGCQQVILPSPFERPWSLLGLGEHLFLDSLQVSAVVFDLLPLQFPRRILARWPEEEQQEYTKRTELLLSCSHIWAISPMTQNALESLLMVPLGVVSVPQFGVTADWLEIPDLAYQEALPLLHGLRITTISGGEWRKNLGGTIKYFSRNFSRSSHLYVVNALHWRERLKFQFLAWKLGCGMRVHFCGYVKESQKWRYLLQSDVFLFLSRAEGLGIPLLEARRAGIPRIIMSRQMEKLGFGVFLPKYYEVALPEK